MPSSDCCPHHANGDMPPKDLRLRVRRQHGVNGEIVKFDCFFRFFSQFFQKRKMAHLGVRRLCSAGTPTAVTRMCSVLQHSQYNCNYHRCQATHSGFTRTTPHHRTLADDNNTVQDILFFFFTCLAGAFPSPHTKGIGRKESNVCRD